jgi:hypothetical protein
MAEDGPPVKHPRLAEVENDDWVRVPNHYDVDREPSELMEKFGPSFYEYNFNSCQVRRTYWRTGTSIMAVNKTNDYARVVLRFDGAKQSIMYIHRLACWLKYGKRPTPNHSVDHIDRNPLNNMPENLRWATTYEQASNRNPPRHLVRREVYRGDGMLQEGEIVFEYFGRPSIPRASNAPYFALTNHMRVIRDDKRYRCRFIFTPMQLKNGYPIINVDGQPQSVHLLMFAAANPTYDWPEGFVINHKDANKLNWRPENLEAVTRSENARQAMHEQRRYAKSIVAPKRIAIYDRDELLTEQSTQMSASMWFYEFCLSQEDLFSYASVHSVTTTIAEAIKTGRAVQGRFTFKHLQ